MKTKAAHAVSRKEFGEYGRRNREHKTEQPHRHNEIEENAAIQKSRDRHSRDQGGGDAEDKWQDVLRQDCADETIAGDADNTAEQDNCNYHDQAAEKNKYAPHVPMLRQ